MDFSGLVDWTRRQVLDAGGVAIEVPPEHAVQVVRDTTMRTERLALGDRGEVRMVSIEGRKVHIVTAFVWPEPDVSAPVYAMEFVVFGPRPIVAVIDAVGLGDPEAERAARALMRATHERCPLPQGDDPPGWFVECRSGDEMFVRPRPEDMPTLCAAHQLGFTMALERALGAPRSSDGVRRGSKVVHYKRHHAENSPGRPWLVRSFGDAWTENYLTQTVFA